MTDNRPPRYDLAKEAERSAVIQLLMVLGFLVVIGLLGLLCWAGSPLVSIEGPALARALRPVIDYGEPVAASAWNVPWIAARPVAGPA